MHCVHLIVLYVTNLYIYVQAVPVCPELNSVYCSCEVFDSQGTHSTGGYRTSQTETTDMFDSRFVLFVCLCLTVHIHMIIWVCPCRMPCSIAARAPPQLQLTTSYLKTTQLQVIKFILAKVRQFSSSQNIKVRKQMQIQICRSHCRLVPNYARLAKY